ncbi:SH3 domain-containing protein [Belnapia rosea]|uniref:SH3 domain-containing protein n=1 Tax=Belnapia rosea TaxID=938405 RepID=UPI00087F324C|nr:SH3 domain-containing protein [Belnapia rosea]SDB35949.1 SH3 domain-containing protein [Belnapia rosea]
MIHHPEAQYRLDQPTQPLPEADTHASMVPEGWISLPDCLLEQRPASGGAVANVLVPLVLLHPEFGVALLGVPGAVAEAAAAALRQRLEAARFSAIFPGYLPVVTLAMMPGEPLNLQRRLAAAFAAVPPLHLAGGDGWIALVQRLLLSRPLVRVGAPTPVREARPESGRRRPGAGLAGLPWPMLGLAGGGLVIGLLLGLNHHSPAPQTGADVPAQPAASAPPSRPEAAPPPQQATAPRPAPAAPQLPQRVAPPPAAPPPAPAAEAPPAPNPALPRVLVRTAANLRAGPDSSAPVLRTAARGEAFRIHGEARGGWIQVGGAAPEGWIHSSLLTEP